MLPVVRTKQANEDLTTIWLDIGVYNPQAADNVLDAIDERWRQIARHPYSGVARDDIAPGLRHLIVGQYLTFYRITDASIEIVRVLHGHRNISKSDVGS